MSVRERVFKIVTDVFKHHGAETIDTPVFGLKVFYPENFMCPVRIGSSHLILSASLWPGNSNREIRRGIEIDIRSGGSGRRAALPPIRPHGSFPTN